MSVTRNDVARRAGVSIATVSNVVNGKSSVNTAMRAKVLAAIEELKYHPNHIARSLKTKKTREIALFSSDIMNPYYAEVACGIEEEARKEGYIVCMVTSEMSKDHRIELFNRQFEGVIMQSDRVLIEDMNELSERGTPIVFIGGSEDAFDIHPTITQIRIDIYGGAHGLFEYLVSSGHTRIGFIASQRMAGVVGDMRLKAYRDVLAMHKIEFDPSIAYLENISDTNVYAAVERMIGLPDRPTAIFSGNDSNALPVISAINDHGLRTPDDVSVAGFDNLRIGQYCVPKLTTVDIPKYRLGQCAMQTLLKKMRGEEAGQIVVETQLVLRNSIKTIHGEKR